MYDEEGENDTAILWEIREHVSILVYLNSA